MINPKYKHIGNPLVRLAEECAEVIHIICKIQRFGPLSYHPRDPKQTPNRDLLFGEIADIKGIIPEVENFFATKEEQNENRNL